MYGKTQESTQIFLLNYIETSILVSGGVQAPPDKLRSSYSVMSK